MEKTMLHRLLLAFLVLLCTWLAGCVRPAAGGALVDYRRSGGFAGFDDHMVIAPDGKASLTRRGKTVTFDVPSQSIADLQSTFAEAGFTDLRRQFPPARQGADQIEYIITYRGHTVRAIDGAVPESLQAVIQALNQLIAQESQSSSSGHGRCA